MREAARESHRLSAAYKRKARRQMAELEEFCRANDIPLHLVEANTEARTDGRNTQA